MPPPFPFGTTVTVTRRTVGTVDEYGNPTYTTATSTIDGCAVAPRTESELTDDGRTGVIIGLNLFAPFGADLQFDDLVTVDAVVYEIDGEAGSWFHPMTGHGHGVVAALKRVEG